MGGGVVSARVGMGTQNTRDILSPPHPARSMNTAPTIILMFVGWLLGMQNTFSHGDRFFLPFFFLNGGSVPRPGHKSLFTP